MLHVATKYFAGVMMLSTDIQGKQAKDFIFQHKLSPPCIVEHLFITINQPCKAITPLNKTGLLPGPANFPIATKSQNTL